MIASSHWTATENALIKFSQFNPSAVTLKTTSVRHGSKASASLGSRNKRKLASAEGQGVAYFTDGPKAVEFWDLITTGQFVELARQIMPQTEIGLSVLQGEPYDDIRAYLNQFHRDKFDYVELNLKYAIRSQVMPHSYSTYYDDLQSYFLTLKKDVNNFLSVFDGVPRIVKFPREIVPFLEAPELADLISGLYDDKSSIILANSLRTVVPRTYDKQSDSLTSGVVTGDHLLMSTYDSIFNLQPKYRSSGFVIASGGVSSLSSVLDVALAGATAVQLCTVFDDHGPTYLESLRNQLSYCIESQSFADYVAALQSDPELTKGEHRKSKEIPRRSLTRLHEAFAKPEEILQPMISKAIELELGSQNGNIESGSGSLPARTRFVQSRGNLSGYLIQKLMVEHHDGIAIDAETSGDFMNLLRERSFEYDLSVMPRSIFEELKRQNRDILSDREPVELMTVGRSVIQLVGRANIGIEDTTKIFHFDGPTARNALMPLSRDGRLNSPAVEVIKNEHLHALLAFWPDGAKILAKPPLSWMYSLLTPEGGSGWDACWESWEDLLLVSSVKFKSTLGDDTLREILSAYADTINVILSDTDAASGKSLDLKMVTYLGKLLNA